MRWQSNVAILSGHAGESVNLRSRLRTDSTVGTTPDRWRADDIARAGCERAPREVEVFHNGFG